LTKRQKKKHLHRQIKAISLQQLTSLSYKKFLLRVGNGLLPKIMSAKGPFLQVGSGNWGTFLRKWKDFPAEKLKSRTQTQKFLYKFSQNVGTFYPKPRDILHEHAQKRVKNPP